MSPAVPERIEISNNSLTRDTLQQSTVVAHIFWHTNSVPENLGVELLAAAIAQSPVRAVPEPGNFTIQLIVL